MARPARNAPHGGSYDDDGEAQDDRSLARLGKRGPSRSEEHRASQAQMRRQAEARQPSEPEDVPWQDLDELVTDEDAVVSRPEKSSPPVKDARSTPDTERKTPARETARDEQPISVPLPEPTYPPPLVEDSSWETQDASPEPTSEATTEKPPKAGKRRAVEVIYLVLLAIVAASLSAAVVLFLF